MDDTKDDARYPPIMYGDKNHKGYGHLNHKKHSVMSSSYSQPVTNEYVEDNNDDDEEGEDVELLGDEEDDDEADQSNSIYLQNDVGDNDYEEDDEGEDDDDNENHGNNDSNDGGNDDSDDEDEDEDDGGGKKKSYKKKVEDDLEWHPKKRKLKSLISAYEVVPHAPSAAAHVSDPKPYIGSRNSLTDWTEHETFVLLDAWGNRFLQQGRKSLRSEQWQEVAEEVSEVSKTERTDAQCRNRLDTLKKKYKKERTKLAAEMGGGSSKWVYFKRMDKLLSPPPQQAGLSCGLDSGEYVFMNPRVYLNRANGLDEMRDSPGNSECTGEDDDEDLGGLDPKRRRHGGDSCDETSCRLLAESIQKFGDIYEKIENSKRQQMVELEKMRMDFHRELETQKKQILERLQHEIAKLDQRDNEENDDSVEQDE